MEPTKVKTLFRDCLSDIFVPAIFTNDHIVLSNTVDGDNLTVRVSVPSDRKTVTIEFVWDNVYNAFVAHCDYLSVNRILSAVESIKIFLLGWGYECEWTQLIKNAIVEPDEIPMLGV